MVDAHGGAVRRQLRAVLDVGAVGNLNDGALLERFIAGRGDAASSAAFAALVDRHGPMVLRVCRSVLRDEHEADDAAQATFLVLARRAQAIRRTDALASWLFGVALRVAAKSRAAEVRRRRRERRGAAMRAGADVSRGPGGEESWAELHDEIGRLGERHRGPVVLCGLEGLTHDQAADRLGLPVRTLQRRLAEAKERLRSRLARRGLAPAVALLGTEVIAEAAPPAAWAESTVRAASMIAAGGATASVASAPVAAMTEGVVMTMAAGRLKAIAAVLLALGATAAAWVAAARVPEPVPADRPAQVVPKEKAADIAIRPASVGPRIEGIVVDEAGRGVEGASVSVLWAVEPRPTTTAADGTFTLETDEPRRANLAFLATADAGARQGIFRYQDLSGSIDPRTPVRIVLKPAREVKVVAVDGQNAPVPGARVDLLDVVFPVARGTTDARGIVTLRTPAEVLTHYLVGVKPGVGFDYFETSRSVPAVYTPPPPEVRLVLNGTRTVRVKAVDSTGQPVPGVDLAPWLVRKKGKHNNVNLGGFMLRSRTDAGGVATFDWLPSDMQGRTGFMLASHGHSLADLATYDAERPVDQILVRVLRNVRLSGKVLKPDGAPAAGILVEATRQGSSPASPTHGRARTAADGTYALSVAPEEAYMIAILDDTWAAPTRGGVVTRQGQDQAGIDFTLGKGAVIRGRVTVGPASAPAVGEAVVLSEQGSLVEAGEVARRGNKAAAESLTRLVDTDGDGRYAFRVAPGDYGLSGPSEPGGAGRRGQEERLQVADGQVIEKDFHLRRQVRPGKQLRGTVRAKTHDGPTIAGALVVEEPIGARVPPIRGTADDRGRFELPHTFGKAFVYARTAQGDLAGYVLAGEDIDQVTIVASPAVSAHGRVVDASGKPRAGVAVHYAVVVGPEGDGPPMTAGDSTVTDADGRFTATGLLPGSRCRLFATNPEGGNSRERSFDVDATDPIRLDAITLDPAARR